MKTLVSMTDFVISQIKTDSTVNDSFKKDLADILNYALFLKQPLTLGMFVPCDNKGNVLTEPLYDPANEQYWAGERFMYDKAKEKVLFKDCTVKEIYDKYTSYHVVYYKSQQIWVSWTNRNVEDMIKNNLELTESATKQIFG